jgi:mRNA-degrading endonuclease toxin of MazEF toxin-antitoxin module
VAGLVPRPLRWAIAIIDLDPAMGHEQAGVRRALVVSSESYHRSRMATVCPISARSPKYPNEVALPRGEAGQTKDAVILCHQVRTLSLDRVTAFELSGKIRYVTDRSIRRAVRAALAHQLGLDIPAAADGA